MVKRLVVLALVALAACGTQPEKAPSVAFGPSFEDSVVAVAETDPDYASAGRDKAEGPPGAGGMTVGTVIRVTKDITLYRLWDGPPGGIRIGHWWAATPPSGSAAAYRDRYEICRGHNTLAWEVQCTLKSGALVVIGPGQSMTCGKDESYPAHPDAIQIYVQQPWNSAIVSCQAPALDHPVDPADLSIPKG